MKLVFDDLNGLYNAEMKEFKAYYRMKYGMSIMKLIPIRDLRDQLINDLFFHFPFLNEIPLNLWSSESIYRDGALYINPDGGITSPFEAILHEIGHCIHFLHHKKLERVRIREFGLSPSKSDTPLDPSLRMNKFKNELMAGAYQMKMMIMAGISVETLQTWLDAFCNTFTLYNDTYVDKLREGYSIEDFKNDVVTACDAITVDSLKHDLKVLCNCFKTGILSPIEETS